MAISSGIGSIAGHGHHFWRPAREGVGKLRIGGFIGTALEVRSLAVGIGFGCDLAVHIPGNGEGLQLCGNHDLHMIGHAVIGIHIAFLGEIALRHTIHSNAGDFIAGVGGEFHTCRRTMLIAVCLTGDGAIGHRCGNGVLIDGVLCFDLGICRNVLTVVVPGRRSLGIAGLFRNCGNIYHIALVAHRLAVNGRAIGHIGNGVDFAVVLILHNRGTIGLDGNSNRRGRNKAFVGIDRRGDLCIRGACQVQCLHHRVTIAGNILLLVDNLIGSIRSGIPVSGEGSILGRHGHVFGITHPTCEVVTLLRGVLWFFDGFSVEISFFNFSPVCNPGNGVGIAGIIDRQNQVIICRDFAAQHAGIRHREAGFCFGLKGYIGIIIRGECLSIRFAILAASIHCIDLNGVGITIDRPVALDHHMIRRHREVSRSCAADLPTGEGIAFFGRFCANHDIGTVVHSIDFAIHLAIDLIGHGVLVSAVVDLQGSGAVGRHSTGQDTICGDAKSFTRLSSNRNLGANGRGMRLRAFEDIFAIGVHHIGFDLVVSYKQLPLSGKGLLACGSSGNGVAFLPANELIVGGRCRIL